MNQVSPNAMLLLHSTTSQQSSSTSLQHPPNALFIFIRVQPRVQVLPPFKKHARAYEFEPGRKLERLVLEHFLEPVHGHIFVVAHLIEVRC